MTLRKKDGTMSANKIIATLACIGTIIWSVFEVAPRALRLAEVPSKVDELIEGQNDLRHEISQIKVALQIQDYAARLYTTNQTMKLAKKGGE